MNRYFDKNRSYNSNSRIFNEFYGSVSDVGTLEKVPAHGLRARLSNKLSELARSRVLRIAKAVTFSVVLIAFLGVVGAIEHGRLGIGSGLLISAVLLGLEYLCLCRHGS